MNDKQEEKLARQMEREARQRAEDDIALLLQALENCAAVNYTLMQMRCERRISEGMLRDMLETLARVTTGINAGLRHARFNVRRPVELADAEFYKWQGE